MFYNNVILKDSLLNDFIKDKPYFFKYDNIYRICMDLRITIFNFQRARLPKQPGYPVR